MTDLNEIDDVDQDLEVCTDPAGHEWDHSEAANGFSEGRCYCIHCGADGDA